MRRLKKKSKIITITKLKHKADTVFSIWIRNRDKECFTCGSRQNLQCGHYVSRSHNSTRYDEENCHAQCIGCNVFKSGNMAEYSHQLGWKLCEKLLLKGKILHQFTRQELQAIIDKYTLT